MKPIQIRNLTIGEGMPKICVPIVGRTKEEILQAAEAVLEVQADFVEWRADWFQQIFEIDRIKAVVAELRKILGTVPLLFTIRTKAEGGETELDEEQYIRLNKAVIETGNIDLLDVEVYFSEYATEELVKTAHECEVKVIGSNHDFDGTPEREEIIQRLRYMQSVGVDIPKIAVMPCNEKDVLNLLEATEEMKRRYAECPIITMSMSGIGTVSRIAGEVFGSDVTFGCVGTASAPGQIEVKDLKYILEILHGTL